MSIADVSVARAAAPSPVDARTSELQRHALDVIRDRLISDFPSVPAARIGALVEDAYSRTGGARVQAFRALLAEREVRAELHEPVGRELSQRWRRPIRPAPG